MNNSRLDELDFLKCIFILLMIAFHLVYFESLYPYAKEVVYTFHMPGFLIISGYVMQVDKPWRPFLRSLWRLLLPYLVMESAYVLMATRLPINEHIDHLTPTLFLDKLLLHPLGPYWYLRSLVICGLVRYGVARLSLLHTVSRFLLLGLLYALLAHVGLLSLTHGLYFLAGAAIRRSAIPFVQCFPVSWLALPALVWLVHYPANLHPLASGGVLIVVLTIGLCLWVYPFVWEPLRRVALYVGRNTLPIYIYSPLFTFLCKGLVPYLHFDSTGLLFLLLSLVVCVLGGLAVDRVVKRVLHFCSAVMSCRASSERKG